MKVPDNNTLDFIRQNFHYDKNTGQMWIKESNYKGFINSEKYHIFIFFINKINKKMYAAHQIAWFLVHNVWPNKPIDHINRVKADNRFGNLRLVTPSQNARNSLRSINATYAYYCKDRDLWHGMFWENLKGVHVGYFDKKADATSAAKELSAEKDPAKREKLKNKWKRKLGRKKKVV